jgi:hypothetical protein
MFFRLGRAVRTSSTVMRRGLNRFGIGFGLPQKNEWPGQG